MTLSTSKGRTFDHSGIYLLETVYGYGQIYIEIKKRKEISKLKIHITHKQTTKTQFHMFEHLRKV